MKLFKKKEDEIGSGVVEYIAILSDTVTYNEHHKRGYLNREGVYVIKIVGEDFYHFLDIKSNIDITKSDYLKIQTTDETSVEYVWRDALFKNSDLDLTLFEKANLFDTVCRPTDKEKFRKIVKKENENIY